MQLFWESIFSLSEDLFSRSESRLRESESVSKVEKAIWILALGCSSICGCNFKVKGDSCLREYFKVSPLTRKRILLVSSLGLIRRSKCKRMESCGLICLA